MSIQKAAAHPILDLLGESRVEHDWILVTLLGAVCREGSYGQFIKLTFRNEADKELTATCDRAHFDSLFPYIEQLNAAESSQKAGGSTNVLIPVFLGDKSNKWKFSHIGAAVLLKESVCSIPETELLSSVKTPLKYDFRLRSNTTVKNQLLVVAKQRGMSLNEFLGFLINREIEATRI